MKLCECGCGEPTNRVDRPDKNRGVKTGDYSRFKVGHWARLNTPAKMEGAKKMVEYNRIHAPSPLERFLSRISVADDSDCLIWTGSLASMGYGKLRFNYKEVLAHRFIYEYAIGPIPEGMQIDHICYNRACVNPSHLRVVTPRENKIYNSKSASAINAAKTHCVHGHEFSPANTSYRKNPHGMLTRACMQCARDRDRKRRNAYQLVMEVQG